jgi:hypothetical protein
MVPKSSDTTQVTLILGAKLLFCSASFLVIYNSIDALSDGSTPWGSFDLSHDLVCEYGSGDSPPWMNEVFEFWYCDTQALIQDLFANDYSPYSTVTRL